MKVLIPTDAFPPVCGGSGWSTYELARGLRARGHDVTIVQPRPGETPGIGEIEYDGFRVRHFGAAAPNIPYVRNYYKSERLTRSLAAYLQSVLREDRYDIVHPQHVMTTLAGIAAAKLARVPVVATVRDYWPVCYWSDLLRTREGLDLCPECTVGNMRACIQPRAGALWPLALPMIPYMRANLFTKRTGLARADAVIAVSHRIAEDLRSRAPELAHTRIEVIPNPVNVAALRAIATREQRGATRVENTTGPYALYLGKLAPNKGTSYLIDVVRRADLDWPLVIAGEGPDRTVLEAAAKRSGRNIHVTGWVDKDDATRLLAGASMLIFPSRGPESLSRVLIEASALGVPIAAMDTGGTRDIIEAGVTGLLSTSPEGLAEDVRTLRRDEALRRSLGDAARRKVEREFDADAVVARIEALYKEVGAR
ncbi:MAG TPA: glycosyltransferase family 4 protein [Vicinamibacterales bacterium]|nr:glycosyltransferase family 4 protein [Vicinamibacterales bacterium]